MAIVKRVAEDCQIYDIPFLVEIVSYPIGIEINNPTAYAAAKERIVAETAKEVTALPVDVFKAEFPGSLQYHRSKEEMVKVCRSVDTASKSPWVLLSGGADFDTFYEQVEIACQGGASGFLGGRAIWQEGMAITAAKERIKFLSTIAVDRMKRLCELTERWGVPWYKSWG